MDSTKETSGSLCIVLIGVGCLLRMWLLRLLLPLVHPHPPTACSARAVSLPCHLLSLAAAHSPVPVSSWEVVGNSSDEKGLACLQLCGIHSLPYLQGCPAYRPPPFCSASFRSQRDMEKEIQGREVLSLCVMGYGRAHNNSYTF